MQSHDLAAYLLAKPNVELIMRKMQRAMDTAPCKELTLTSYMFQSPPGLERCFLQTTTQKTTALRKLNGKSLKPNILDMLYSSR